jgi:methylmalonyl-CoA mutase C-terminal domain/subunit
MQEKHQRKIRALVAKPGLDGHDRGVLVLCHALKEAGMEVIYLGLYQSAENIAKTAIAEDVDVVALSLLDDTHMFYFPKVVRLLREAEADDICVVGGGTIPEKDKRALEEMGISGNFGPGTSTRLIVDHIVTVVEEKRISVRSKSL